MSLTAEEIRIKLGLDDKELDEGTRRALANLSKLGKESKATWYEHGEKPAKAFKKALHEITDQFPLLGGAARLALSPIGGTIALATTAALHFKKVLEDINERLDKIGESNAKPVGNVRAAMRAAARGNSADRERAREEDPGGDSISEMIRTATTSEQRQRVLTEILRRRAATERRVVGYNSDFRSRDRDRLSIAKADENIKSMTKDLADAEALMPAIEASEKSAGAAATDKPIGAGQLLLNPALAGLEIQASIARQAKLTADSQRAKIKSLTDNIQQESDTRDNLKEKLDESAKAHDKETQTLAKLEAARQELLDKIKVQNQAQALYNQQISILNKRQHDVMDAAYTPGLQEMAGYSGPGGALAREALAAREYAKRSLSLATPGELYALRQGAGAAFNSLRASLRSAHTGADRNRAFRSYGESINHLLTGRITPEHALEGILQEIKALNQKASADGLIVQGKD